MDEFTNWDIISSLLLAMRWTVLLSLIAFAGGTLITIVLLLLRLTCGKTVNLLVSAHVNLFQGTPLLMQLFLVFFTFPLLGVEVSPWTAAGVCLTLYASAYLIDIWYSAVQSLPKGQWEACRVLGLSFTQTLGARHRSTDHPHRHAAHCGFLRPAYQGHGPDFHHRIRGNDQGRHHAHQRHLSALQNLRSCGSRLFSPLLPALRLCAPSRKDHAMSINRNETILGITGLQKYYGKNHVLKGIDLNIHRGEVVAIIGQSGSGKSTLLRCMNGLEEYQEGQIIYNGELTITSDPADAQEISRSIGMIFQQFNLFPHLTAIQNVMLAPQLVLGLSIMESHILAEQMLVKVGLGDRCDFYPSGLSGGQQQRVAIARALAMYPKVLLCDEITSALDPELVGEVLKVIAELAEEGLTIVLVTHEMAFARDVADRVVFMYQGKIHEEGPAKEIFAHPKTPELTQFISRVRSGL